MRRFTFFMPKVCQRVSKCIRLDACQELALSSTIFATLVLGLGSFFGGIASSGARNRAGCVWETQKMSWITTLGSKRSRWQCSGFAARIEGVGQVMLWWMLAHKTAERGLRKWTRAAYVRTYVSSETSSVKPRLTFNAQKRGYHIFKHAAFSVPPSPL